MPYPKPALTYNTNDEGSFVQFLNDWYTEFPIQKDSNWPDPPAWLTPDEAIARDKSLFVSPGVSMYANNFRNFKVGVCPDGRQLQLQYITPTSLSQTTGLSSTAAAQMEAARIAAEAAAAAAVSAQSTARANAQAAAGAKTKAIFNIKYFLESNYPLPEGWYYRVEATEDPFDLPNIMYTVQARAVNDAFNEAINAGVSSDNVHENSDDSTVTWNNVANNFANVARPVYLLIIQRVRDQDARNNPAKQDPASTVDVSAQVPINKLGDPATGEPTPVTIAPANQGNDSSGQAPWDAQPDVQDPNPDVSGTILGAGYTGTIKSSLSGLILPDGFLDWLNLTVGNAARVLAIRNDEDLTAKYLEKFGIYKAAQLQNVGTWIPSSASPAELPNPYNFNNLDPVSFASEPVNDGVLPGNNTNGGGTLQDPPANVFNGTQGNGFNGGDAVEMMLQGNSTDFLNMLAIQYAATLATVASIAAARSDLNSMIEDVKNARIENYLRNFNASSYATAPVPETRTPEVQQASTISGIDTKTVLIGLGLLALAYFVSQNKKATA